MPKLSDLVRTMPVSWDNANRDAVRKQQRKPKKRVRLSNYALCMRDLERLGTEGLFSSCKVARSPKKAKNWISREQNGTICTITTTKRFTGSRITCVCKSAKY